MQQFRTRDVVSCVRGDARSAVKTRSKTESCSKNDKYMKNIPRLIAIVALLIFTAVNHAFAQGTTAFTYQGQLSAGTNPANGSYDMTFAVYDANIGGTLIAGPITNSAVAVSNGLFTVTLNFGSNVFTGTNYWVQMAVSPAGAGTFSTLTPNQPLTPTPYALSALSLQSPQANALCPAGAIMAFGGTNIPTGWLICDGSVVSRTTYANLFAVLGTAWGIGDGSATFNLPDMRGNFLRGVDNGAGNDPDTTDRTVNPNAHFIGGNVGNTGDAVGSYQADQFAAHNHGGTTVPTPGAQPQYIMPACIQVVSGYFLNYSPSGPPFSAPNFSAGATLASQLVIPSAGGSETRPKNVYVNYIIKY